MTMKELADRLDAIDTNAFASLLIFEYAHDDEPERAKKMIVDALRYSGAHGFVEPRPSLDEAD